MRSPVSGAPAVLRRGAAKPTASPSAINHTKVTEVYGKAYYINAT